MRYALELEEAREEGREENSRMVILNMLEMHMPVEVIAKAVDQTPQYMQQVIDELRHNS